MAKIIYLIRDPETNTFYSPWNPEYVEPTKDMKQALRFDAYSLAHQAILEAEFPQIYS